MSNATITCSHLSFSWPDDTPVFTDLSFSIGTGRTGLIAPNGTGKSTLLKLIAGHYQPATGSVTVNGVLGYLPQTLPLAGNLTVAEVLEVAPILHALHAIESGDTNEKHFATIGNDWDIEERARAELDRLGLYDVTLDRKLRTLSGGQAISLGLVAQLLKQPDVLLLDEPTNNLDTDSRRKLYEVLENWKGLLLLVSHDRNLLDTMDRIAELRHGDLSFYSGNFTEYETALRNAQETAEKNLRNAEQTLKREKREKQIARERAARRSGNAARNVKSAGLPKIVAGALQRRAQESAGRADETHSQRVNEAQNKLADAQKQLRDDKHIALSLPATHVPEGRTVFLGENLKLRLGERDIFAHDGIDLAIRGPERIALTGSNGVGKSTLLRIISGDQAPDTGDIRRVDGRIAYLSQRLDLLNENDSIIRNLEVSAPQLTNAEAMHLLARFLFKGDRIHLPIKALSGGERLRATLACVLFSEPAPQLLLLDEPTNNLDLVSINQLETALNAYEGAFIVVSHDQRFLAEIKVNRWLHLSDGELHE